MHILMIEQMEKQILFKKSRQEHGDKKNKTYQEAHHLTINP